MKEKINKILYWTPRILSILFICFLALFSLDVFGVGYTFWETVVAFLMHNIPVFVLIIVLVISWKYEIVGGIGFILAGLLYIVLVLGAATSDDAFQWYMLVWTLQISGPAFLVGILFLINWYKKTKIESK